MAGHFVELTQRLRGWSQDHVLRNTATLALGAGGAKVLAFVVTPIITRIYSPEHFGVLALFTAVVLIGAPLANLRFSVAIPLPKHNLLAINVFVLGLLCTGIVSVGLFALLLVCHEQILAALSMDALSVYWWLIPVSIAGTSLFELLSLWATRVGAFKAMAASQMRQTLVGSATKIVFGLAGFKPLGLIVGQTLQQVGGAELLFRSFRGSMVSTRTDVSIRRLRRAWRVFSNMPMQRMPAQLVLRFSMQAPLIFVAALYSADITGQLGLALTALALPVSLLGTTAANAYYSEVAKLGRKKASDVLRLTRSITKRMVGLAIIPAGLLILLGPRLFTLVFGDQWLLAGQFSQCMAIYMLAQFASAPIVNALSVFGRQAQFLAINAVRALLVVLVFAAAWILHLDPLTTILAYSIVLSVHYAAVCLQVFSIIRTEAVSSP